jgi:hypothetical protein
VEDIFYFVFKPGGTAHTAPLHLLQGRFLLGENPVAKYILNGGRRNGIT